MRNKKYNGIKYVAISLLVILVSVVGVAQYGKAQVAKSGVAELTEFANSIDGNVNAFQTGLAYLGEEIGLNFGASPGGDFYNPVIFHDTVIENGAFNLDLHWSQATSTANGTTFIVLGKKRYSGPDELVCSGGGGDAFIYVDGLVPYTATYRMGTTTASDVSFLTNTTTQTIITGTEVATSTSFTAYGFTLNADDEEGDWTREAFTLSPNDVVVVSLDFTTSPFSTSTMPLLATQGLTADGYAKLSCKKAE